MQGQVGDKGKAIIVVADEACKRKLAHQRQYMRVVF
jgi:hypothetical protein